MSATATYLVDGVDLDDDAGRWFLEASTNRRGVPAKRSRALTLPGRHGVVWVPGAKFTPGTLALSITVTDKTSTGTSGGPAQAALNMETLAELVGQNHRLATVTERLADGAYERTTLAEVETSVDLSLIGPLTVYRVPVVFNIPGAFWRDGAPTADFTAAVTNGTHTIKVASLEGSTAPIRKGVLRVRGPFDAGLSISAVVRDSAWAEALVADAVLNMTLTDSQYAYIDLASFTARRSTSSTAWTSGGTDITSSLDYATRWPIELLPARHSSGSLTREVRVRVVAAGTGATTALTVRAERTYL